MHRRFARSLPPLALILALGTGPLAAGPTPGRPQPSPFQLAVDRAQLAARAARAQAELLAMRTQMGLDDRHGFEVRSAFTNAEGLAIVHLDHTFLDHRVWGSQAIAHVFPGGEVRTLAQKVQTGITLQGGPGLSAEQAVHFALARLAAKGPLAAPPEVERVVFPAEFLGGLASVLDPETGNPVLHRKRSVHADLADPHVWAYEIRTRLDNGVDAPQELTFLVHGDSGAILRVDDGLQRQAVTPVQSPGWGYYRGHITLNTSRMANGTYALYDTTRGSLPNPVLQSSFTDDGSGWTPTGIQVFWNSHDPLGKQLGTIYLFSENPINAWGNGNPFTAWGFEGNANGQTTGVDTLSAMASTWDFYRNVFGRDGMDAKGTTVYAKVLDTSDYYIDNAYWSNAGSNLTLGAGSFPTNPKGLQSVADLDVVAHEMTHGVTIATAKLLNNAGVESGGLNEASSDFFAQMVKAYTGRPSGAPVNAIPGTGTDWQIGLNVGHGTPIRWMDKPSRDQRSPDGWYDGMKFLDSHYSAGPLNRALSFLAQGASPSTASDRYSPYLPAGMGGLGNDPTARIWFKTLTERLLDNGTGTVTYADARREAVQAAKDLYGGGAECAESIAAENAFAAVNVGNAHGQPPRTQVQFADWRHGDWIERNHPTGYSNRQYLPIGEAVWPRITVLNNANTEVVWSVGGPSMYNGANSFVEVGGKINPDGSWTTPLNVGWHSITATSKADPLQFAEGRPFLVNMDTDMDLDQDALDLGGVAFSWFLATGLNPSHSMFNAPWVDDADVAAFVDAFKATWPVK